jgi:hypothetical protein
MSLSPLWKNDSDFTEIFKQCSYKHHFADDFRAWGIKINSRKKSVNPQGGLGT